MTVTLPHHPPAVFIQPACHLHRFHRPTSKIHPSSIVERPERLRAVYTGLSLALARLEEALSTRQTQAAHKTLASSDEGDLIKALEGLGLDGRVSQQQQHGQQERAADVGVPALFFAASPDEGFGDLRGKAVRFVHEPSVEGSEHYLGRLESWCRGQEEKVRKGECEIPEGLPQNDLYLCSESILAIRGALSTTIQAVDVVIASTRPKPAHSSLHPFGMLPSDTPGAITPNPTGGSNPANIEASSAFCAIRPPGHHCGEDNPMGFCFVNNVVVGAAHAYIQHNMDRAIILDIDLHHGNGTQEIALRLNEDTYREELLIAGGKPADPKGKRGLKTFYGSIHDIYSFPCEDGDMDRIKDASVSLASHGQYIENIHLSPYSSEEDFYTRCYPRYLQLLTKAKAFLESTAAEAGKTMVFISAGFDACEHESPGMQRHGGRVPVSFYARFTQDVVAFAREHAQGRVVSVLEGGYGDRALASAAAAHLVGLADAPVPMAEQESWWTVSNIIKLEKATKPSGRRSARAAANSKTAAPSSPNISGSSSSEAWLTRTAEVFASIEVGAMGTKSVASATASAASSPRAPVAHGRTLRDRSLIPKTEKASGGGGSSPSSPVAKKSSGGGKGGKAAAPKVRGGGDLARVVAAPATASIPPAPLSPPNATATEPASAKEDKAEHIGITPPPPASSSSLPAVLNSSAPSTPTPGPAPSLIDHAIEKPKRIVLKFLRPAAASEEQQEPGKESKQDNEEQQPPQDTGTAGTFTGDSVFGSQDGLGGDAAMKMEPLGAPLVPPPDAGGDIGQGGLESRESSSSNLAEI